MKKVLITLLTCLLVLGLSGCSEVSTSKIQISKIKWEEKGAYQDYSKMGLLIQNSSDSDVDIEIDAECYGEGGSYLDKRATTIYALAPKAEYLMNISLDSGITDISYSYECKTSIYNAIDPSNMETSFESENGTGTLTVKNKSDKDTKECECTVLFYDKKGEIVGSKSTSPNNGDIPSGKTVDEEIDFPITYDSVKIYTNAYAK